MKKTVPILIIGILVLSGFGAVATSRLEENFEKIESIVLNQKNYLIGKSDWFYYPPYDNYAPSGMPDFDQKQNNWKDPVYNGWTFCGAVAVANIFWHMDSFYSSSNGYPGDNEDLFPLVLDYNAPGDPIPGPNRDDHSFNNVNDLTSMWDHENGIFGNELIERIAWYVDTNGCRTGRDFWGTSLNSMYEGVSKWLEDIGLLEYFKLEKKYPKSLTSNSVMPVENQISPYFIDNTHGNLINSYDVLNSKSRVLPTEDLTFHSLASQIINGSYVILGITGYDEDKNVYISHWVSVAGVNIAQSKIALSDPFFDNVNPTNDATLHNDASIVSHDIYKVNNTSPFPDEKEYFWLEDYIPGLYSVVPAVLIISPLTESIPEITTRSYFIKPDESYFFINDKHIVPTLLGNTIIVGDISFEANAFSIDGIERVEFYVNNDQKFVDYNFPYEWVWGEKSFGRYSIKIIAIDSTGNIANDKMRVWKFF